MARSDDRVLLLAQVKRANQALTEKAHGKDESSAHAVAAIDPALYY